MLNEVFTLHFWSLYKVAPGEERRSGTFLEMVSPAAWGTGLERKKKKMLR